MLTDFMLDPAMMNFGEYALGDLGGLPASMSGWQDNISLFPQGQDPGGVFGALGGKDWQSNINLFDPQSLDQGGFDLGKIGTGLMDLGKSMSPGQSRQAISMPSMAGGAPGVSMPSMSGNAGQGIMTLLANRTKTQLPMASQLFGQYNRPRYQNQMGAF
jgi:hypothetical protein